MHGVYVQNGNGSSAARCQSNQAGTIPSKMPRPPLTARVKQHYDAIGFNVSTAQIARLGQIAIVTGPREALRFVGTAVFLGKDMLDVEGKQRQVVFMETAVLAAPVGACSDQPAR